MDKQILNSDVTILGHIAKDVIQIDGKNHNALGGAVFYGGIAGSHMGLKITIITKLKKQDFSLLDQFIKNGIKYFAYPSVETSGIKNVYTSTNMEERTYEPLGFAGPFSAEEIPQINTKVFIIGPIIAGEINLELLDYLFLKFRGKLALDIQGFIRGIKNNQMTYFTLTEKQKVDILSKVDYLKVDETEAKILTNQSDIVSAGNELKSYGLKEVLLTHKGGISLFTDETNYNIPWRNKSSIGRTGRGDTALISYLGSRLYKNPYEALVFAAALTSLKMESLGPFSLPLWYVDELIKKEYKLKKD
jgi:sugar/nucleoside kinase (ribokinase family)